MSPSAKTTRPPLPGRYWRQWAASAVSNVGDGMNGAAMPTATASTRRRRSTGYSPRIVAVRPSASHESMNTLPATSMSPPDSPATHYIEKGRTW